MSKRLRRRAKTRQQPPAWSVNWPTAAPHTLLIGAPGGGKTTFMLDPYEHEKKAARRRTPELLDRPENYSWPKRMLSKLAASIFARG